jgi:hypothetical protein
MTAKNEELEKRLQSQGPEMQKLNEKLEEQRH